MTEVYWNSALQSLYCVNVGTCMCVCRIDYMREGGRDVVQRLRDAQCQKEM